MFYKKKLFAVYTSIKERENLFACFTLYQQLRKAEYVT